MDLRSEAQSRLSSFFQSTFAGDGVRHSAVPGALGFLWLIAWRWLYYPPEAHPRISQPELRMIVADKVESDSRPPSQTRTRWRDLLKLPQTWGTIIARSFTDPVWFFVTDWFPIFLVAKGIA